MGIEDHTGRILSALRDATRSLVIEGDVGILFSGGLDSTIVAGLLKEVAEPTLYTVGVVGSYDLRVGEETAAKLDLPWVGVVVDADDLLGALPHITRIMGTLNPVKISFEMPLYFVSKEAKERMLYSGQGADELFAGYARYLDMGDKERRESMDVDLETVLDENMVYERSIAGHFDKVINHPYLDPRVVAAARDVPIENDVDGRVAKAELRKVGRALELGEAAERKKKAAQYGSGIMRALKSEAKSRGMTVRSLVMEMGEKAV